jgi:hypothetical protein
MHHCQSQNLRSIRSILIFLHGVYDDENYSNVRRLRGSLKTELRNVLKLTDHCP